MSDIVTDQQGRPAPPLSGTELSTLLGFLDFQRATVQWKCRGLTDEQLRVALPPSSITLGGLLKHLAYVEDYWFAEVAGHGATPQPWASADTVTDPDWEWHSARHDSAEYLRTLWAERVETSRATLHTLLTADGEDRALNQVHPAWDGQGQVSLRWILVHMIEEYARHNGHADLLRESLDGQTGE